MDESLVRSEDCGNYLVLKFLDTVYQCERRKLQKLVIFADFIFYLKYQNHMIPLSDMSATTRGLAIAKLSNGPYDNVFNSTNIRDHVIEDSELFGGEYSLLDQYDYNANALNACHKECLDISFKYFGAYSGEDITNITKKTSLWEACRDKDYETPILPIPEIKYCQFIYKYLFDNDEKADKAIVELIDYLKRLCTNQ